MFTIRHLDHLSALEDQAYPWLLQEEPRHNFLLGTVSRLRSSGSEPSLVTIVEYRGDLCGVVVSTPNQSVMSRVPPAAIEALAAQLDQELETLPRLVGGKLEVSQLAKAWSALRSVTATPMMHSRLLLLGRLVAPANPAAGSLHQARKADLQLVESWLEGFMADTGAIPMDTAAEARYQIEQGDLVFWVDPSGERVSMAGITGRTPNGARIGWVYTPPSHRGKGYAAMVTAALSLRLLDQGLRFCCLNTDAANPLTNRLYSRLGYEFLADELVVGFSS